MLHLTFYPNEFDVHERSVRKFVAKLRKELVMSTAVKKIKEYVKRDLTNGFIRFMMHHGFQSNFCNPSSCNEKGSVEAGRLPPPKFFSASSGI